MVTEPVDEESLLDAVEKGNGLRTEQRTRNTAKIDSDTEVVNDDVGVGEKVFCCNNAGHRTPLWVSVDCCFSAVATTVPNDCLNRVNLEMLT